MRKLLFILSAALALIGFLGVQKYLGAKDEKTKKPKYSIKQVMKLAHKDKLMQRVAEGDASKEEKEKLLGLYIALSQGKPPRGDAKDWKKRCKAIVIAARGVVKGDEGAEAKLKKAVNCMACHEKHKKAEDDD